MMVRMRVFQRLETLEIELFEAGGSVRATVSVCPLTTGQKKKLLFPFQRNTDCIPILLLGLCLLPSHPFPLFPLMEYWVLKTQNM